MPFSVLPVSISNRSSEISAFSIDIRWEEFPFQVVCVSSYLSLLVLLLATHFRRILLARYLSSRQHHNNIASSFAQILSLFFSLGVSRFSANSPFPSETETFPIPNHEQASLAFLRFNYSTNLSLAPHNHFSTSSPPIRESSGARMDWSHGVLSRESLDFYEHMSR